ncbi:hypothetical protein COO60DRAFT_1544506 [Scenedesmus sp. NREL 46B-D3]|nr:hypothetical protein COO60DRAFT_1544506 [Scenedesmus sp. NREL 46B-D3]
MCMICPSTLMEVVLTRCTAGEVSPITLAVLLSLSAAQMIACSGALKVEVAYEAQTTTTLIAILPKSNGVASR